MRYIISIVFAVLSLGSVVLWWKEQVVTAALLALLAIVFIRMHPQKRLLYSYGVAFVCGPFAEIAAMSAGAWQYTEPLVAGIPLWLPFLWGNAALFILVLNSQKTV